MMASKATTRTDTDPETLTLDEWDALLIEEWFEADPGAPVPTSARQGELLYAHENLKAWELVDEERLFGLSKAEAKQSMANVATRNRTRGEERFNPNHDLKDGKFTNNKGGTALLERPPVRHITAAEARGNSRPVSADEFERLANEGHDMLDRMQADSAPTTGLDRNFAALKASTYAEVQNSWGGATINAHTGVPLESDADRFALSIKPAGVNTVSIPETASREQFDRAMDEARSRFQPQLRGGAAHLGVFHDDDNNRIDFDPVVVVDTNHEVEAIGAATHAIGGAYHFKSGDGFWPPHVAADQRSIKDTALGNTVHWDGPGEWRSYADAVQTRAAQRHLPGRHNQKDHAGKKQVLNRIGKPKFIKGKRVNKLPTPDLSPEEREAVRQYTITNVAADINWHLRQNQELPEPHATTVRHLRNAIARNPLQEDIEVTRYATLHAFDGDPEKVLGRIFADRAILSTTLDDDSDLPAVPNAGPAKLTITVPKGTPALYIPDEFSSNAGQNEVIFLPRLPLAGTNLERPPPRWQVRAEVVR